MFDKSTRFTRSFPSQIYSNLSDLVEDIERIYKCGWNGCEKAYGTLNHLNAHVTLQSHGQKRTPDEFG
ncbi:hypothetical protein FOPG_17577 [Fusarium oxysporum f. sp. conglutinans race 2 54008]|uniref:C2H2-type domain-containing protein n=1 Tax=Fusarium oxysporum f. sp. conglutinans race 2 54008 TaxID=1089457 RepID=X0H2I5_FUSOX|nr:hypothetical protein FOPG_17577 [Fusarium oxysporum f. sp. conglutinans race 2 54008]